MQGGQFDLVERNRQAIESLIQETVDRLIWAGCGEPYARKLAVRALAEHLIPPATVLDVEQFLQKGKHMEQKTIRIGDLKVLVTRGPAEITKSTNQPGKYDEMRELVLNLRPGDPSLRFAFDDFSTAELARNAANGMSCPMRGSTARKNKSRRLPWPYRTTCQWTPSNENSRHGPGMLDVWVVSRENQKRSG